MYGIKASSDDRITTEQLTTAAQLQPITTRIINSLHSNAPIKIPVNGTPQKKQWFVSLSEFILLDFGGFLKDRGGSVRGRRTGIPPHLSN